MKNFDTQLSKWIYDRVHASPVMTFFAIIGAKYMIYLMVLLPLFFLPDVFPLTSITVDRLKGIALMIGLAWLVTFLLQIAIRRKRPFECKIYEAKIPMMCKTPSFPSAHAAISFAAASLCIMGMRSALTWFPGTITPIALLFYVMSVVVLLVATWISVSRVAVGVHYVSDIIVGSIIGFFLPWIFVIIAFTISG